MPPSLATKQGQVPTYSPRTLETSRRRLEAFLTSVAQSNSPLRPSRSSVADLGDSPLKARIYRRGGSEHLIEELENASLGVRDSKKAKRLEGPIMRLPDDLIQLILEYLPPAAHHIHTVSRISRRFNDIAQSPTLWARLYLSTPGWRMSVDAVQRGFAVDIPPDGVWEGDTWCRPSYYSGIKTSRWSSPSTPSLKRIPIHFPTLYRSRCNLSHMIRHPNPTHRLDSASFPAHKDSIYCIKPLGRWIFTGSRDKSVMIWRLEEADELGRLSKESLHLIKHIPGAHTGSVLCLAVSLDDQGQGTMITGSSDKTVQVWEVDMSANGGGEGLGPDVKLMETLEGHQEGVLDVLLTTRYIVSCSKDSTIRIYDRSTLALKHQITGHAQSVNGLAASPDGDAFASASADETWRIWELQSGREIGGSKVMTKSTKLACIAWNGDYIVTGDVSRNVNVFDAKTGNMIRTCTGHTDLIRTVAIDADEGLIYSGSYDGAVRIWDLHTGVLIRKFLPNHDGQASAATVPGATCIFDIQSTTNRLYIAKQNGAIEIVTLVTGLPYTHIMTGA